LYDYYTKGGISGNETKPAAPTGTEKKTDTGRTVYGGGGIMPDEIVKTETIPYERNRQRVILRDAIFSFALDLTSGKVAGFENYKAERPITFGYDLKTADFPITENLYQLFKKYAADQYKVLPARVDREREFIEQGLRIEVVTAAYGTTTSLQVFNEYNNQLKRAIELLPRAKQLAQESARVNAQKTNAELNR
jgi:carboxyl-terminal processing protease